MELGEGLQGPARLPEGEGRAGSGAPKALYHEEGSGWADQWGTLEAKGSSLFRGGVEEGSPRSWVLRFLRSWTQALTSAGCVSQSHSLPGGAFRRILGVTLEKGKYLCNEALLPAKTGLCFYFASDHLSPS